MLTANRDRSNILKKKKKFNPREREIRLELIKTGKIDRHQIVPIKLNETEMRMILDSLVEDGYVICHKSDKFPYDLTYQYISGKK